jgi:HSP20 family protein
MKAKTMALSEFPRLGFDPFVELRECKVRCLPFSADQHPAGRQQRGLTDELPEVTPSDVTVNLAGRVLTVVGARRPRNEQNANWQRQERVYGSFSRTVQLPFRVDADKVEARFNSGILEIELQRLEADRPKKIVILAG